MLTAVMSSDVKDSRLDLALLPNFNAPLTPPTIPSASLLAVYVMELMTVQIKVMNRTVDLVTTADNTVTATPISVQNDVMEGMNALMNLMNGIALQVIQVTLYLLGAMNFCNK